MKISYIYIVLIIIFLSGCQSEKISNYEYITIDITAKYPKKELILQDFMDVDYIPLETNEEFITLGNIQTIGMDLIITRNRSLNGDIFIFNKNNGKSLRKINRQGQGAEEYVTIFGVTLDKDKSEIYINDAASRKISVYDLFGNFQRSFKHEEGYFYTQVSNFDKDNLICYDNYVNHTTMERHKNVFLIVSKQDGSVTNEILIPYKELKSSRLMSPDPTKYFSEQILNWHLISYNDKRILVEPSSDTIYSYSSDHQLRPFIVRIPSIQSMEPEVFLFPGVLTDRYYFMQIVKKEFNFEMNSGFPKKDLVYDKSENKFFEYVAYNNDFINRNPVNLAFELTPLVYEPVNSEIAFAQKLDAADLVQALVNGELKGKLKEVASKLSEEDNPVIMIAKYKK